MKKSLYILIGIIIIAVAVFMIAKFYFPGEPEAPLTVLCGGSFKDPAEKLVSMFKEESGLAVEISFGQSEDLLPHVKAQDVGDIFITHSPYMRYTEEAESLSRWAMVGYISPVLVAKKGNPASLEKIEDLAQPDLKVALPSPEFSTCGEMVEKLLTSKGIWEDVKNNVGNAFFRSHSEVATAIKVGNRDAGVMWNGVAHNWLDAIEIIPTPYEYDEEIKVGVIGLNYSKNPEAVEKFLKYADKNGEAIFNEFGYTK